MKRLLVLPLVVLLVSCGGGSKSGTASAPSIVPPVQAASGFTNASLTGTYAFGSTGVSGNFAAAGSGVVAADGNGNLSAGEETLNIGGVSCHLTFSGTYSVNSNGTGTATLTSTPDAASLARGCTGGTGTGSLAIGNSGNTLILAGQGSGAVTVATAIKQ